MKKVTWVKEKKEQSIHISNKFWDVISDKAYPLSKGTVRVPISLEPFTITQGKNNKLQNDILLVLSAVKKLVERYFVDDELRKIVSVDTLESELINNSQQLPLMGVIRFDLLDGKKPKILEINADFPDGLFMHDVSSEYIQKINDKSLQFVSNIKPFLKLLEAHNVGFSDSIFIGYNKNRRFLDEFELTRIRLEGAGFKNVTIGAFEDLEFKKNTFYYKGKKIDVLRRGSELSKLRVIPQLVENIILAQNANTLKVINNFKMRLLGHKSLLAALHIRKYSMLFTPDELGAIKSLVPITRKLEEVQLKDVLRDKDFWVLKPSDLAEGDGVTIGTSVTKKHWKELLDKASKEKQKWILQEKVTLPQEIFDTVQGNTLTSTTAYYDFCPHVFLLNKETIFGNILVRFSNSEVLNIMKGGGLTYLFEVKPKI